MQRVTRQRAEILELLNNSTQFLSAQQIHRLRTDQDHATDQHLPPLPEKDPAMTPKLSVVVHVDVDGRHARVAVTGRLTAANQQGLHPVLLHARTVFPAVTADLTAADCRDPHAVVQLRQALDLAAGPPCPVAILTAPMLAEHPGGPATSALRRDRRVPAPAGRRHDSPRPGAAQAPRCPLAPRPALAGKRHGRPNGSG